MIDRVGWGAPSNRAGGNIGEACDSTQMRRSWMTGNASCSVWDLHSAELGVELIIDLCVNNVLL